MFEWVHTAIEDLESEQDAIDQRRGEIDRVLETLRSFAGDADAPSTNGKTAKKTNERTNERSKDRAA